MLANGITLGYRAAGSQSSTTYTNLAGLKEVPDIGLNPEKVDNTVLTDTVRHSEFGIGDPGDLQYRFKFENTTSSSYRILKGLTRGTAYDFCQTMPDGTKFEFTAQTAVRVSGGGVNGVIDFVLSLAIQSDITTTDPTTTSG